MYLDVKCLAAEHTSEPRSIDGDIRDFLAGRNEGAALLHALYYRVLDEPVPERLLVLFKH